MVTITVPAGCSLTSPIENRALAAGTTVQSRERSVGQIRSDHREELSFIGDVQRIQAQQLACAADFVAHRNPVFGEQNPETAIARQFIQRRRGAPARRIAHPANARPGGRGHRFNQRQDGTRVRPQIGFEIQFIARQKNGDPVIADGSGKQNLIARADRARRNGDTFDGPADSGWW